MKQKQEETCENCGCRRRFHHEEDGEKWCEGDEGIELCTCKKFIAKNHSPRLGKSSRSREPPEDTPSVNSNKNSKFTKPEGTSKSLSDKVFSGSELYDYIKVEDVKNFIKRLKEALVHHAVLNDWNGYGYL